MQGASAAEHERARLRAVHDYVPEGLVADNRLDDFAKLIALTLRVGTVVISACEDDRQRILTQIGLSGAAAGSDATLCALVLEAATSVVVPDATCDQRFCDGEMRFCAGVPLRSPDGYVIGALCALDVRPREPSIEVEALELFAKQVVTHLQFRRRERGGFEAAQRHSDADEDGLRLRVLLDSMAEGVVVQDQAGAVVGSNAAALRMLRSSRAQLEDQHAHGPPLAPLVRRDGSPLPDSERPAAQVLRTGTAVTDRIMGLCMPDGKTVWLNVDATPLRVSAEAPLLGVVITMRNITEQVLLQEALEESLRNFRTLVASLPIGVAVSHGSTMRYVNRALAEILGYGSPSELQGRETFDVIHPSSKQALLDRYLSMAAGAHPEPAILECQRRDGTPVLVEVVSMPTTFEDKPAVLALIRDVTESARARQAQERSEARFRTLVNFAPVGIFETDVSGSAIYANERLLAITGLTRDEVLGDGWASSIHPEDLSDLKSKRSAGIANGNSFEHEFRIIAHERVAYVRAQTVPLQTDGKVVGFLGVLVDLTELQLAHVALVQSLAQKETLLKEIHHRVKNNLQVIASLLRLGRGYVKDPASLSVFNDSIARLHSIALIHERLYQSHDLDRIEMSNYLQGLMTELVRANSTQQRVLSQVLADRIFFDIDRCVPIGLIVNELVSNALKHAFPSSITRTPVIVVGLSERGNDYELTVRDNGVGMPEKSGRDGSLGLRIVANLAKQLRGSHRIERDNGTAFHIVFPKTPLGDND